jgi:uncharacterized protein (TIGR02145 family)
MNGAASSDASPSGVQGICPKGWHLPSRAEWATLVDFLGGEAEAGAALTSTSRCIGAGNGTNVSGFSTLAPGIWDSGIQKYITIDSAAVMWSSTELKEDSVIQAHYLYLSWMGNRALLSFYKTSENASCRCVKDP